MSRILKRPNVSKRWSTNEGIMSGLVDRINANGPEKILFTWKYIETRRQHTAI